MIEVEYPAGSSVKAVACRPVVKLFHGFFDALLHNGIFRLKIKGAMLENYVLSLGNIREYHLLGHRTVIIRRQTHAVALRKGNAPAAYPALRGVQECHELTASAVVFAAAHIVKLALYAVQQTAYCIAVLTLDKALLLPEIPVTDAFVVPDVQEFVCGDSYKLGLYRSV